MIVSTKAVKHNRNFQGFPIPRGSSLIHSPAPIFSSLPMCGSYLEYSTPNDLKLAFLLLILNSKESSSKEDFAWSSQLKQSLHLKIVFYPPSRNKQ